MAMILNELRISQGICRAVCEGWIKKGVERRGGSRWVVSVDVRD